MSFFNVTIEVIASSTPIQDTDRLDLTTLRGVDYQFVTGRGQYQEGDQVLYFPLDAVIPEALQVKLGVAGKLAGKKKDRVKTVRLRGCISQGLVGKIDLIFPFMIEQYGEDWASKCVEFIPTKITEWLGVTKYEPPIIQDAAGNLKNLPGLLHVYDIEGCERNGKVVDELMVELVWILEKIEGQNASVLYIRDEDKIYVNQRRFTVIEIEGHTHSMWNVARSQRLIEFVKWLSDKTMEDCAIYFENTGPGIQANIYKLPGIVGYIFDVQVGSSFISKGDMFAYLDAFFGKGNYLHAPILCAGDKTLAEWLGGKTIKEASNGQSLLYPCLREGIVISPVVERRDPFLKSRCIIKQRDPVYLLGSDT